MSYITKVNAMASMACLAIALAVGNAAAQEQSDQDRSVRSEQSQDNQSDDEQSGQNQGGQQSATEREQGSAPSDSQTEQQSQQRNQQQQERQRNQQSSDRGEVSQREAEDARDSQWPQPDGHEYGSDSLRYGDRQFGSSRQGRGERQGGLGVGLRSDGRDGVVVSHIHSGSPAEVMGVRPGDRITQVNGREVRSVQEFIARIRSMDPGEQIELDIRRASGGERTVRGELESRQAALAEHAYQGQGSDQPGGQWQGDAYRWQNRENRQTSFEDQRGGYSDRSGQMSQSRLSQIERQIDRLSREIEQLRFALQEVRGSSEASQNRERTARYEDYQDTVRRQGQSNQGWSENDNTFRQAERDRDREGSGRYDGQSNDQYDEGPGGEIGSDRQHVGSENINRD